MKIRMFDAVILLRDIPEKNLCAGDGGFVVDIVEGKPFCTVDFFRNGEPYAVEAVMLADLRKEQPVKSAHVET